MAEYVSKVSLKNFDSTIGLDRGASRIKEILWYLVKVFFFLSALPYPNGLKVWLLRSFGAKVGQGVVLKPRVNIHFPWKLEIGDAGDRGSGMCGIGNVEDRGSGV